MIFLTVGTQFPFDRLVREVDAAVGRGLVEGEIFAQIGQSEYQPVNFASVPKLDKATFDTRFREATAIISHAGMGSITLAMEQQKPMLVMPRLKRYREVVNDHQVKIARKYEDAGYFLVAYSEQEIAGKLVTLKDFIPRVRTAEPQKVVARVRDFLQTVKA